MFHVATFMVNKEKDPMRNEKKKHIANDCVMIVYNESGEDYSLSTIKVSKIVIVLEYNVSSITCTWLLENWF